MQRDGHVSVVNLNHHLKHIHRDGHVSIVKLNHHLKHIHRDGHVSVVKLNHHLKHIHRDGHVSIVNLNHHLKHYTERWTCICCQPESSPETYRIRKHVSIVKLNHHLKHIHRDGHVSIVNLNHHLKHIQRDTERWTCVCCEPESSPETHTERYVSVVKRWTYTEMSVVKHIHRYHHLKQRDGHVSVVN